MTDVSPPQEVQLRGKGTRSAALGRSVPFAVAASEAASFEEPTAHDETNPPSMTNATADDDEIHRP